MNSVISTAILFIFIACSTAHASGEQSLNASQVQLIKAIRPDLNLAFILGRTDLNSDGIEDLLVQALYPDGEGIAVLTASNDKTFKVAGISKSWPSVNRLMYEIWTKEKSIYISTGECIHRDCTKTTYEFKIREESVVLISHKHEKSQINGKETSTESFRHFPNDVNASGGKSMLLEEFSLE